MCIKYAHIKNGNVNKCMDTIRIRYGCVSEPLKGLIIKTTSIHMLY